MNLHVAVTSRKVSLIPPACMPPNEISNRCREVKVSISTGVIVHGYTDVVKLHASCMYILDF